MNNTYYGILSSHEDEIDGYISNYQTYLNSISGISNVIVSIPSYEQYQSFGLIENIDLGTFNQTYPWLNSTSYILSDGYTDDYNRWWNYSIGFDVDRVTGETDRTAGLRPVITVLKSALN